MVEFIGFRKLAERMATRLALQFIYIYRPHVSPIKGFACPYRVRTGKSSESMLRNNWTQTMKSHERTSLLEVLKTRFARHMARHAGIAWADVQRSIERDPAAIETLRQMEITGGEPDVVGQADDAGRVRFIDCSEESPGQRRSLCYDGSALASRKENKPSNSAVDMAAAMGAELLTEQQYRALQQFGDFDTKTSSWINTPADVRALGGALFCDRRYGRVFVYHNGAQSYYAARGFRGSLLV